MSERTFLQRHLATRHGYWISMAVMVASFLGAFPRWPGEGISALTAMVSLNALYYSCVIGYALAVSDIRTSCTNLRFGISGPCSHCRITHP